MERMELLVYSAADLTRPLATIGRRWAPTLLEEHNALGGGSFRVRLNDPLVNDGRNVFQKGRIVETRIGGRTVGLWEIQKDNRVFIESGEQGGEWIEYAGPTVRDWLSHAIVYPQAGIASVSDERQFNYSAALGSWYKTAEWKTATVLGLVRTTATPWGVTRPEGWPVDVQANWLWDRPNQANHPPGDVYFRKAFTTTSKQSYRVFATADDYAAVLIDGERVLSVTEFFSQDRTFTADFDLPAGNHVIAVKARNSAKSDGTGRGPGGLVIALCKLKDDVGFEAVYKNVDRVVFTDSSWVVNGYPVRPPGFTVGNIIIDLLNEAKARGVNRLQGVTTSFTNDLDSYGAPWPTTIDPTFSIGDPFSEVIKQITDAYADVWVTPDRVLHAAPSRGVDRSDGPGRIAFTKGKNILQASTDSTAEISNVVIAKTSNAFVETPGPVESRSQYGRRETFISAVNATEDGRAPFIIQQVFDKFAQERRTPTLRIHSTDREVPWRDFNVGDWVLAPSDDGRSDVKRRIVSISVSEDQETGELEYTCEIDTIQETLDQRLARWLTELGNGTKDGGISGTSSGSITGGELPPLGGSSGTGMIPIRADTRAPQPPANVTATPDVVINETGQPAGRLLVTWDHNGLAVDDTTLTPRIYEVYARLTDVGTYKVIGFSPSKSVTIDSLPAVDTSGAALSYQVYVTATAPSGYVSQPSQIVAVTMTKDTTAPLQPSLPTAAAVRGVFTVYYDGKDLNGAAMVRDTRRVSVQSRTGSDLWVDRGPIGFDGRGSLTIGDLPYGTHAFRLFAVDYAGNQSLHSAVVTATSTPIIQDSDFDAAFNQLNTDIAQAASGELIAAGMIGVRELAVMDFTNYAPGGNFDYSRDLADWTHDPVRVSVVPANVTAPAAGTGSLQVVAGPAAATVQRTTNIPVSAGERWKFEYQVKMSADWNGTVAGSRLRVVDQIGLYRAQSSYGPLSTVWVPRVLEYVIPDGMTEMSPSLLFDNTAGTVWVDQLRIRRMDAGELLVDGVVKARQVDVNEFFADNGVVGKLTAQMAVFLTNEDGTGAKSTITGQGMKVTYTDAATGEVREKISLGTFDSSSYFGLTDDSNELSVSIDKDGGISGRDVAAENSFIYRGDELTNIFASRGKGIVAWASRTSSSAYWANAFQPYLHLRFTAEEGRSYMVETSPIQTDGDSDAADTRVHLQYEVSGADASTSSQKIAEGISPKGNFATRRAPITINRLITPPAGDVSLLISYSALNGRAKISVSPNRYVVLTVTDIGPALVETGEDRDGTGDAPTGTTAQPAQTDPPPPSIIRNYDRYFDHVGVRSYLGSGATYAFNTAKGYQGLQPNTSNGNLRSIWTFPSLTTLLSGAMISDIYAYFYFEHWNYGAGGTARIRTHGYSTVPSTYGGIGNGVDSAKWPRARGRWVRLPSSLYAGFQSGTIRGLALDGNGTLETYGIANRARLRIKFTK